MVDGAKATGDLGKPSAKLVLRPESNLWGQVFTFALLWQLDYKQKQQLPLRYTHF